jgi:hypothetical protein
VSPTLSTLMALAHAFYGVSGRQVTLADMVKHDGYVSLTSALTIKGTALQRFLGGQPVVFRVGEVPPDDDMMPRRCRP